VYIFLLKILTNKDRTELLYGSILLCISVLLTSAAGGYSGSASSGNPNSKCDKVTKTTAIFKVTNKAVFFTFSSFFSQTHARRQQFLLVW